MINVKLSFKIIRLTFCDLSYLLKMASKMASRLLYVWHYVSVVQLNGCLNRLFYITILWVKDIRTCMIPKVTHKICSKHILSYTNSMTPFEIKYLKEILWKIIQISDTYLENVIVLNNINGDCLIATSKFISLECVVSDCVYVFKRVSKMATRRFTNHYILAF